LSSAIVGVGAEHDKIKNYLIINVLYQISCFSAAFSPTTDTAACRASI